MAVKWTFSRHGVLMLSTKGSTATIGDVEEGWVETIELKVIAIVNVMSNYKDPIIGNGVFLLVLFP